MRALIGHTGFVGSNLLRQSKFDEFYNSQNIKDISGKSFDCIICSGVPAVKWKANKEPEADLANIESLMRVLETVNCRQLVLISTVDVYKSPMAVDEDTPIDPQALDAYGKHRFLFEQFLQSRFKQIHIIRLPGLFGQGLKKNVLYDFMHENALHLVRSDNVFQFYNLDRLYKDIEIVQKNNLQLVNFATEPVSVREIAYEVFGRDFENTTQNPPIYYDMRSRYAKLFNGGTQDHYLMTVQEQIDQMKHFVHKPRNTPGGDQLE